MASYTEAFTGTDNTTPSGWTNLLNSLIIKSNQGAASSSGAENIAIYTGATFGRHQYVQQTVKVAGTWIGLYIRNQNAAGNVSYGYVFYTDGTHSYLKVKSGSAATLQTFTSVAFAANDVMRIEAQGATIRCYKNGTQLGTDTTDGTWSDGYPGYYSGFSTTNRVDDWECGDLTVSPADTVDQYVDFENGADADVITTAIMTASSHPPFGTWSLSTTPLSACTISTTGERALGRQVSVDGTTYTDGSSTRGFRYHHSTSGQYAKLTSAAARSVLSVGFFFRCGLAPSGFASHSMLTIKDQSGRYLVLNIATNNVGYLIPRIETNDHTDSTDVQLAQDTWIWVAMKWDTPNNLASLAFYDPDTWAQDGTTSTASIRDLGITGATVIEVGEDTGHGDTPNVYSYYDDLIMDWTTGTFPLLPTIIAGQPFSRRFGGVLHSLWASPLSGRRW